MHSVMREERRRYTDAYVVPPDRARVARERLMRCDALCSKNVLRERLCEDDDVDEERMQAGVAK